MFRSLEFHAFLGCGFFVVVLSCSTAEPGHQVNRETIPQKCILTTHVRLTARIPLWHIFPE